MITEENYIEALKTIEAYNAQLKQSPLVHSFPSKNEVVDKGFTKAKNADYNHRNSLRDMDHDLYFSGWMDCYEWLLKNDA
jgi:hypothetical protein